MAPWMRKFFHSIYADSAGTKSTAYLNTPRILMLRQPETQISANSRFVLLCIALFCIALSMLTNQIEASARGGSTAYDTIWLVA
jgi:hypothetical protein